MYCLSQCVYAVLTEVHFTLVFISFRKQLSGTRSAASQQPNSHPQDCDFTTVTIWYNEKWKEVWNNFGQFWSPRLAIDSGVTPPTLKARFGSSSDAWFLHKHTKPSSHHQIEPFPSSLKRKGLKWIDSTTGVYTYRHIDSYWRFNNRHASKYTKLKKDSWQWQPLHWSSRPMSVRACSLSASRRLAGMEHFIGIWAMWGHTLRNAWEVRAGSEKELIHCCISRDAMGNWNMLAMGNTSSLF